MPPRKKPAPAPTPPATHPVVQLIELRHLEEAPFNPRKTFAPEDLQELAEDIRRRGVLQPILARPLIAGELAAALNMASYQVVFGARRLRAAELAGLEAIPTMVRELSDAEALEIAIIENAQRSDVHPLEEADGYRALLAHGHTAEELAGKVGKSKAFVYARLKLCDLGAEGREAFVAGRLTASTALLVARLPAELQEKAVEKITTPGFGAGPMSYREAAHYIQREYMLRLADAPFSTTQAGLADINSCTTCPLRTGAQPELFPDVGDADVCTSPPCYQAKVAAAADEKAELAKERGLEVLRGKEASRALMWNAPYVDLGAVCYDDKKERTWGELLQAKKKAPLAPVAVVAISGDGVAHELVVKQAAVQALQEAGHDWAKAKLSPSRANDSWEEKEAERKEDAKRRQEVVRRAIEPALTGLALLEPTPFWRLLAELVLHEAGAEAHKAVAQRRGLKAKATGYDAEPEFRKAFAEADLPELSGLVVELLVAGSAAGGSWTSSYGEGMQKLCAATGTDLKAFERELKAEEKAKAKKKPAAKKGGAR